MPNWCLPRSLQSAFLAAIRDGRLTPERLGEMSSEERRAEFSKILGPENAAEVNAAFEKTLLLKDRQRGFVTWAKKIGGITEPARRDLLATINRLDRVLQPDEERAFLADLAAKRLGVTVTAEEAREIFKLSQKAEQLRTAINEAGGGDYRTGWTVENGTAYGRAQQALLERIEELKPGGAGGFSNALLNILNFPKSALTSIFHWSAPFVQGWGMISTKQWWNGLAKMFQYFASEENYRDLDAWIIGHPDYALAVDGKLGLTKITDKLTTREEAIQSSLLQDANQWLSARTGVPNLIAAWSRSFTGFLNYVRFSRFTQLLDAARLGGEDIRPGSRVVSDIANVVNNFTGRGNLGEGDRFVNIGPALNAVFFSPRKIVATMEMFNPARYVDPRISPTARRAAMRQLAGSLVATGAVLTLAKVMGAQVSMDPRSTDFAKINIGGEKLDMTGGNASYLRLVGRLVTGQEVNTQGKLVQLGQNFAPTRADLVVSFIRGKLAPIASLIASALYGKNPAGQAFSLTDEARNELMPIVINSFIDYAMNNPDDTAAIVPSLSAFLGVGLESPEPPMSESGRDVWGDPLPPFGGTPKSYRDDPVNKALVNAGYTMHFPSQTIRGQPLTPQQFDDYSRLSGRLAHMRLEQVTQMPEWDSLPQARRASIIHSIVTQTRDIAATSIMIQSQGGPHDILKAATEAKMAAAQGVLEPVQ